MGRRRIHATTANRSAAFRAARKEAGGRSLYVEISPAANQALTQLTANGESIRAIVERLLIDAVRA